MKNKYQVSLIIPALNEAESIATVLASIPMEYVHEVLIVDGGSTDNTVQISLNTGAKVIHESRRGYGFACHAGLMKAEGEIVVFLDADGADDPKHLPELLYPIEEEMADIVFGSRLSGKMDAHAMPFTQWIGNFLAAGLIRLLFKKNITDLCPLRAGKREKIIGLNLQEMTYGYPTEMMIKAILAGWRMVEIPVSYHKRIGGKSKIAGTVRGTILASIQILRLVFRYWLLEKKK